MRPTRCAIKALTLAAWSAAAPVAGSAQSLLAPSDDGLVFQSRIIEREVSSGIPLVHTTDRYIVVHLAENRVFVFEGDRAIWSAPAGTGTGLRLDTSRTQWTFTTPRGLMRVRAMEKDPIWEAPDWHFIERGVAVPPPNHPSRKIRGGMGTTALYLGDGIAIHGTENPQLLLNPDPEARRVSHGCIRLTNEHARQLMHMVDVGTTVLIF